jgi:hypothetical protein
VTTGSRCLVIGLHKLRLALLLSAVVASLLLAAATGRPAMSHPATQFAPTNYQTRITAITPAIPGLSMRVVDRGDQLELTNVTGVESQIVDASMAVKRRLGVGAGRLLGRHSA